MSSTSIIFIFIGLILLLIFERHDIVNTQKFITNAEPYLRFMMEDDYKFLLNVRYNGDITESDVEKLFGKRLSTGLLVVVIMFFLFLSDMNFIKVLICFIAGFLVFKMPYTKLKSYYKANLHHINLMLPYYLKGLEILVQHYTVPVALARSIETAPDVFKPGLERLIAKIEAGDSSVDPYMDFAKEYPVRDSMRMMRLLYRLGLGSQENKQEQLMLFSKTISSLQNKAREQKYKERLEKMEKKTMMMLFCTGGGIMAFMLIAMMSMMQM